MHHISLSVAFKFMTITLWQGIWRILLYVTVAIGVLFALCFSSLAFYWYFIDTDPPLTSKEVRLTDAVGTSKNVFKRGEVMYVERVNCVSKRVMVYITRELRRSRDGLGIVLFSSTYSNEIGCLPTSIGVEIPDYLVPGMYTYHVKMDYSNNPLHSGQILLLVPSLEVK